MRLRIASIRRVHEATARGFPNDEIEAGKVLRLERSAVVQRTADTSIRGRRKEPAHQ